MIKVKRIYEPPSDDDGARFLVDRLWPRGLSRDDARLTGWLRDVAPSDDLRRWFGHDPSRWEEFVRRYHAELDDRPGAVRPLLDAARAGDVTLVYAARDPDHNNAVALKRYLEAELGSSGGRGRDPA